MSFSRNNCWSFVIRQMLTLGQRLIMQEFALTKFGTDREQFVVSWQNAWGKETPRCLFPSCTTKGLNKFFFAL